MKLKQIRHCLTGYNQSDFIFFNQRILKYSNDFQNRNFSVLWLKWTQTMEMKFLHGIFPWGTFKPDMIYLFSKKMLKYFNNFQNQNFSVFWLQWTEKSGIFNGTYSNLTKFLIGRKILKYFNDSYNWHLSTSLQKWAQTSKVKENQTGHVQIWQYFSLFTK